MTTYGVRLVNTQAVTGYFPRYSSNLEFLIQQHLDTLAELKKLEPKQRMIIRLLAEGYSQVAIAKKFKVSISTIYRLKIKFAYDS